MHVVNVWNDVYRNYVYSVMETYINSAYTTRYKCCSGWTHLHGDNGCSHSLYHHHHHRHLFHSLNKEITRHTPLYKFNVFLLATVVR